MAMTHTDASSDAAIRHYMEMGRNEKVLELVRLRLGEEPERADLHYIGAFACYRLDRYEESIEFLSEAMKYGYSPGSAFALFGHIYLETDQYAEAEKAYLNALGEDPNHAAVHAAYAYLMVKTGHDAKGKKLMKAALALDPNDADVLRFNHLLKLAKDNKEEQLLALERYIVESDDDVSKHIQLGINAWYHDRMKEAREQFTQAYLLDPTNKRLQEMLQVMEHDSHWLLTPLQWVNKLGGPGGVWAAAIGSIVITRALHWTYVSAALAILYFSFVVYSWTAVGLVKLIRKVRG